MAGRPVSSKGGPGGGEAAVAKQLVQSLRGDLNSLSSEAKKRYPAVREATERGGMYLRTKSEARGFSIQDLSASDDVVHPLLFACETKSPVIVKIALSALQKLIQFKAVPQKSVESIVVTLGVLMEAGVEELKVLQTVLLLVTTSDLVQGKPMAKVLMLCFKLYGSREQSIHSTAGVVIRQVVSSMFERLNSFMSTSGSFDWGDGKDSAHSQLPMQASDAYLLFQDICFLTNGDSPAWLSPSLELEATLGLELIESVLRTHPKVFTKEKLFSQLLTERVCPLVVKLFSPSSKYRHSSPPPISLSPTSSALLSLDKPTFGLSIRLLRILNVLIREFYFSLVTQCEIFLSMLVKFLDPDKHMWQRTLAVEILHAFCNQPHLLRSFCESYDMQEHSSKIFKDIVDGLASFIQSFFSSHITHFPFTVTALSSTGSTPTVSTSSSSSLAGSASSVGVVGGSNGGGNLAGGGAGGVSGSGRHLHQFGVKGSVLTVEPLPPNSHAKPICLEMLDKTEVPPIPEGYPLVVAMNALLDSVRSISIIINGKEPGSGKLKRAKGDSPSMKGEAGVSNGPASRAMPATRHDVVGGVVVSPADRSSKEIKVQGVMVQSSWAGIMAALSLLLDTCMDERTTGRLLKAHQTFILLCGQLKMMTPRDALLTSLCKCTLPPRFTMSLIAQRKGGGGATVTPTSGALPAHVIPSTAAASTPTSATHPHTAKLSQRHSAIISSHDYHQDAGEVIPPGGGGGMAGSAARRRLHMSESGGSLPGEGISGSLLPSPMKEQQSGQVTVKNLQCIHTLIQIVHHHGNLLDSAWLLVMKTLQLVVEVFGCVHVAGGGYREIAVSDNPSLALLSVSKKDDVVEVTDKLAGVFRDSRELSEDSVLKMVDALSQLMFTSASGHWLSKESSLFPVAALQEVGEANVSRLAVVWKPVTTHLSEACCLGDPCLRSFAAEALTALIKVALEEEKIKNEGHQLKVLSPLKDLVRSRHVDVRLKQLECVSQVLHSSGQSLGSSWSIILEVVRCATQLASEAVVRSGFQSLQLVIADFLPAIPHSCVTACVDMSGQYGLQIVDINISLTSIGLLWNLADYLYQNKRSLRTSLSHGLFDSVWMQLFKHLSDLCVDERAAVRKSACQTLFSTISAHGTLLRKDTWRDVLWKILFPLLEGVSQATGSASTSSFQTSLLIHHSRNTEQKQWAETQVLTLTGSARLLQSRWTILSELDGFMEAWSTFLGIVRECAFSNTSEVSLAAMKCFCTIVDPQPASSSSPSPRNSLSPGNMATPTTSPIKGGMGQDRRKKSPSPAPSSMLSPPEGSDHVDGSAALLPVWMKAWEVWSVIGKRLVSQTLPSASQVTSTLSEGRTEEQVLQSVLDSAPSQAQLVGLLEAILQIYPRVQSSFSTEQYQKLSATLRGCLQLPVPRDVSPFLVPSHSENALSSMQRLVLRCVGGVVTSDDIMRSKNASDQSEDQVTEGRLVHTMFGRKKTDHVSSSHQMTLILPPSSPLIPLVLRDLLSFSSYAHTPPDQPRLLKSFPAAKNQLMHMNFVPFGMSCQALAVQLYRACVKEGPGDMLPGNMHVDMLQALHPPLRCRFSNKDQQQRGQPHPPASSAAPTGVWQHSVEALLLVLSEALPINLKKKDDESAVSFWRCLGDILEDFLFSDIPEGHSLSSEQMREYEDWDVKVVEMIKRDILSSPTPPPHVFLERLASLLNKGSIHASPDQFAGDGEIRAGPALQLRENFARACFEALLQFSFMHNEDSTIASNPTGQLALNALLERCDDVLRRFVEDERLSGSCPLSRTRMNEVSLVLKSVTILISALKEAQLNPTAKVDAGMWTYVTRLYPALVQCVTCKSHDVRVALKEALDQFSELLRPSALQ